MTALPVAVTAIPVGIAFGFILERAGLGDPRKILGQLVLRDFTVVRVMFGAIVTAMLLLVVSAALGIVDMTTIAVPPTDIGAQVLGGVIFGGGFAVAALCPGTACVAAASGRRDGMAAVAGVFLGTLVTPLLWPALGTAAARAPREGALLPQDLGLPLWAVVLAITALGVAAFMVARRVEHHERAVPWWHIRRVEVGALMLAGAFVVIDARPAATPALREADHVAALDLAAWIRDRRPGLRVIDLREGLDSTAYLIPGAEPVPLARVPALNISVSQPVVLYSDGGTNAAQAWVLLRARGITNVYVLKDGMAAWEDEVLSPHPSTVPDDSAVARFDRARALSLWFGGKPSAERRAPSTRPLRPIRRRNTC
jgi:rhodanese-related sulfurtransferase/uncharacterized membrane protein YedE/YeeE